MKRNLIFTLVLTISISLSVMFFPCQSEARDIARVSEDAAGIDADDVSRYNSISSDGRYVAFASYATNLTAIPVPASIYNVYIKDTQTGEIVLVSKNPAGTAGGDAESTTPRISTDGLYVVFESVATNLVSGDSNGFYDIFLYDRIADTLERISMDNTTPTPLESNGSSYDPAITPDGAYVVFESAASDLVDSDSNGQTDVFLYDCNHAAGVNGITRVSTDSAGVQGNDRSRDPDISDDGLFVAFKSEATNFSAAPVTTSNRDNVYLKDVSLGTSVGAITLLSQNGSGEEGSADSEYPSINSDGSIVAFQSDATNLDAGDTNSSTDVYIWDSITGAELVSKASTGACGNGTSRDANISADGTYVGFESSATNLISSDSNGFYDVFIKNISSGAVERISVISGAGGNEDSYDASLSSDGSYVAFDSDATNLVTGETDIVRDVFVSSPSSSTPPDDDDSDGGGCFINTCSMF